MKQAIICDFCKRKLVDSIGPDGTVRGTPVGVGFNKYHKGIHLKHDYQRSLLLGHYDMCLECIEFILEDIEEFDKAVDEATEARWKYVHSRCTQRFNHNNRG